MPLKIDVDKLEEWIESTFDTYKRYKSDFLIHSIFKEDRKFKLSLSPEKQCYHCWKTDKSGPLWKLVMEVDGCSKKEALEMVYEKDSLEHFESKINSLKKQMEEQQKIVKNKSIDYPEGFQFITTDLIGEINIRALKHCVIGRKIDPVKWKLGYCYKGKYNRRLIIPFYNQSGKLIYFIARSLYNQEPKYINPFVEDKETDVKKEEVLYSRDWNFDNQDVIITEGALDAITLIDLGFNAISIQGKSISVDQINMLRMARNMVLGFDSDEPGRNAIEKNIEILSNEGIYNVKYVFPPINNSDWNKCYLKMGDSLRDSIISNIREYNFKSSILNKFKKI